MRVPIGWGQGVGGNEESPGKTVTDFLGIERRGDFKKQVARLVRGGKAVTLSASAFAQDDSGSDIVSSLIAHNGGE